MIAPRGCSQVNEEGARFSPSRGDGDFIPRLMTPLTVRGHVRVYLANRRRGSVGAQRGERVHAAGTPGGQIGRQPRRRPEHEQRSGQGDGFERLHAKEQIRKKAADD